MTIYEKSTKQLMHEFAREMLKPDQVFYRRDAVRWFAERYRDIKPATVGAHVDAMSVNSPNRRHWPSVKPDADWDLFFRLRQGRFRLWDRERDGPPRYKTDLEEDVAERGVEERDAVEETIENDNRGSSEFARERDLQNYLVQNLEVLETGLKLYEDEDGGINGVEFPAGQRYIDVLAVGADGAYVVIETKVSRAYDRVVGQILRYMGWVKKNLADDAVVRGIIVAGDVSDDLILATSSIDDIKLVEYEISFSLKPVSNK